MKKNKFILGGIVTTAVCVATLSFNSFIFPSLLAHADSESEVQAISSSNITKPATSNYAASIEVPAITPSKPDVNAISEEKAIALAGNELKVFDKNFIEARHKAEYFNATAPLKNAFWTITFYSKVESSGKFKTFVVNINAMNGEIICTLNGYGSGKYGETIWKVSDGDKLKELFPDYK